MVVHDRLNRRQLSLAGVDRTPIRSVEVIQERERDLKEPYDDVLYGNGADIEPADIRDHRVAECVTQRLDHGERRDQWKEVTHVLGGAPSHRGGDNCRSTQQRADVQKQRLGAMAQLLERPSA